MSEHCFDTSYLCKLCWPEHGSAEVAACAADAGGIACCVLGRAEFYTTGLRKAREGGATPEQLAVIFRQFDHDCTAGVVRLLALTPEMFDRVETVCRSAPRGTYLRAADALHLACAVGNGFSEIYSNDKHLLAAAPLFGLRGVNVIPDGGVPS